jgi:predicted lipid carrier protein YhbT
MVIGMAASEGSAGRRIGLRRLLPPFPVTLLQPVLARAIRHVIATRPGIFNRIGPHTGKRFLIDPVDLPFAMLLRPDPRRPSLRAVRRDERPGHDARIAGRFLTLLDMVDGRLDGDALFFTRELAVEGDTEAVVCLRNALDDVEGSVIEDCAELFGPLGQHALALLRRLRGHGQERD